MKSTLSAQGVRLVLVRHDDAGGNAGAVEEAGRQADDGLDHVVIDEDLADQLFLAAPEKHAVGHDGGHVTVRLEARQHVLDEHEVSFFPGFGAPFTEARGELQVGAAVVLRERRIGKHAVEFADLAVVQNLRVLQRIPVLDGEAGDVVEDHVHDADGPDGAVRVLPVEGKIIRVLALLLHILVALNKKAAGADGGIINFIACTAASRAAPAGGQLRRGCKIRRPFSRRCRQRT